MTAPETTMPEVKPQQSDKEFNFRRLEQKFERALAQERAAREEAERRAAQAAASMPEEDESEPYVGHKALSNKLDRFEQRMEEKIDKRAEEKARILIQAQKQESWLRQNPDFVDVMQHANALEQRDPELAESILEMPDTFERQKLVYKNIKALGLHKPVEARKEPTVQERIDANKRSPYYQPSGVGSAPYSGGGDFSASGQKNAYSKMQELKRRLGG